MAPSGAKHCTSLQVYVLLGEERPRSGVCVLCSPPVLREAAVGCTAHASSGLCHRGGVSRLEQRAVQTPSLPCRPVLTAARLEDALKHLWPIEGSHRLSSAASLQLKGFIHFRSGADGLALCLPRRKLFLGHDGQTCRLCSKCSCGRNVYLAQLGFP